MQLKCNIRNHSYSRPVLTGVTKPSAPIQNGAAGSSWISADQVSVGKEYGYSTPPSLALGLYRPIATGAQKAQVHKASRLYTTGECAYNDYVVGLTEVAETHMNPVLQTLGAAKEMALESGLALAGPVGLGVLACCLGADGLSEVKEGIKQEDASKSLNGARTMLLGAEAGAMTGQTTAALLPSAVTEVLGGVANMAVLPLALTHIAVDGIQGAVGVVRGIKNKDGHKLVDGLAGLGSAAAWSAGLVAGPAVGVPLAGVMLAIKYVNGRKERKAKEALDQERPAQAEFKATATSMEQQWICRP